MVSIRNFALERVLLQHFGSRLSLFRAHQGATAKDLAERAGVSRTTLRAIEAGDPRCSVTGYVRVASALGMPKKFELLGGVAEVADLGGHGAKYGFIKPLTTMLVSVEQARHRIQDIQSLALHDAALSVIRSDQGKVQQARDVLDQWLLTGSLHSSVLWLEWQNLLIHRQWRQVLDLTARGQQLRQASPLTSLLPAAIRQEVLSQIRELKTGVVLRVGA